MHVQCIVKCDTFTIPIRAQLSHFSRLNSYDSVHFIHVPRTALPAMEKHLVSLVLALILLSVRVDRVACDRFYILTSSSSSCPGQFTGEPCLTLQQFASSPGRSSSVSVIMESGTHTLSSELSLSNIFNFTITPLDSNSSPTVTCTTGSNSDAGGRLLLTSISHVQLQGVSFVNCGSSTFGTNGNSVLMNDMLFLNAGDIAIRNMSNSVQLNNVTFTNSHTTTIETVNSVQLRNISFSESERIYVGSAGEVSIEDSTFRGGSKSALRLAGIISAATVVRCLFYDNIRVDGGFTDSSLGGAIYIYNATVSIAGSIFDNGWAGGGGAIYAYLANVVIDGNTFTDNSGNYGAVYVDHVNLTIINSRFSNNRAHDGAALAALTSPKVQINDSTFTNNVASNILSGTDYGSGAALHTGTCTMMSVSNSTFVNNRAAVGGAVYDQDSNEYIFTGCSFSSNTASHFQGGAMRFLSVFHLSLVDSSFDSNSAGKEGGAVFVYGTTSTHLTLSHSSFDGNSAGTDGGALYVLESITADWSNFTNNRADSGGALYLNGDRTQLSVSHGYFKSNTARLGTGSGGAVFYGGQYTNVSLVDSTFEYNSAASCGVLNVDDFHHHNVRVIGSAFNYNEATGQSTGGGVACVKNSSVSVTDSTFSHNSAALHAGVFDIDDCVLRVERSSFVNNSADINGGVMYNNVNPTTYTVRLSSFVNNTAGDSGGVMFVGRANSQVSIERSSCGHNSAVNRGGVVAIIGSNLVIDETNVFNNTARLGGAVSACNSDVTLPSELAGTEDSTTSVCTLYDGFINRFNISDFIRQEVSITTSMPVTMTTTTNVTTKSNFSTTTQTEPTTQIEHTTVGTTPNTSHTSISMTITTGSQAASPTTSNCLENVIQPGTNSLKINIMIAITCVSVAVTICLCVLIGVYVTIKIIGKLKRRRSGYSLASDNEFLMQQPEQT